jgi:hypothetical protein
MYWSIRHHIPAGGILHRHRPEDLKYVWKSEWWRLPKEQKRWTQIIGKMEFVEAVTGYTRLKSVRNQRAVEESSIKYY